MAPRKPENEQFERADRIDGVRKELDGKLEGKVSYIVFFGILGTIVLLILAIANSYATKIDSASNKVDELSKRVTVLETQFSERNNAQVNHAESK